MQRILNTTGLTLLACACALIWYAVALARTGDLDGALVGAAMSGALQIIGGSLALGRASKGRPS